MVAVAVVSMVALSCAGRQKGREWKIDRSPLWRLKMGVREFVCVLAKSLSLQKILFVEVCDRCHYFLFGPTIFYSFGFSILNPLLEVIVGVLNQSTNLPTRTVYFFISFFFGKFFLYRLIIHYLK